MWEVYVMTKHLKTKHKIQNVTRTKFNEMLEEAMLKDVETKMMQMYYIEHKEIDYIADVLGYSKAGILKMHQRVLKRIESLL